MRIIKFRAFDTVFKYFVGLEAGTILNKRELCPKKRIELTQFTGLLDKNGKEIYEGDIVKTEFGNFEVYFRDEFGGWYLKKPDGHIEFLAGILGNPHANEVIGNIYQNPELLSPVI